MEQLVELNDVQGIIIKGYGNMPHSVYLMLHFKDTVKVKDWLSGLVGEITAASTSTKSIDHAVNIAFTSAGISQLGLDEETMNSFSREFVEGMVTEHRQRMLGDFGESDPSKWDWGGQKKTLAIHAALLLYAKSADGLAQVVANHEANMATNEVEILHRLTTNALPHNKEHFGFRDGIANPVMKDAKRREENEHPANLINPGEFIFGYKNEYDKFPLSPCVPGTLDKQNLLYPCDNGENGKDLGRNGSMLVFRQMEQKVVKFWDFLKKAAAEQQVDNTSTTMEELGAKMVGRRLDGSPLTKCPMAPEEKYNTFDNFGYAKGDFDGFKCPVGAHIRRTNPRDNFLRNSTGDKEKDIEKSQMFMKRFRILRRGRAYGEPVVPSMNPQDVLDAGAEDGGRGLHFLCFNTNIGRQFELIQQTWINNPKFAGLYEDPDPIVGYPEIMGEGATTTFTEQAAPLRKKVSGIPRFVEIKGGAYFFMPGIKALEFLSSF